MSIFFDFVKTSLLRSKKLSFLSRISKNVSFFLFWFFDKHHRLTPLQNVDSLEFYRTFLFLSEKHSFFMQNIKKCFFLAFFAQKKHIRKRSIFWQKPCTNPFAKCRFFFTLLQLYFPGLKSILYYPEYKKMFPSGFFC